MPAPSRARPSGGPALTLARPLPTARSISEELSSGDARHRDSDDVAVTTKEPRGKDKDREERDEEVVKVYDGHGAVRKRTFKVVAVRKDASLQQLLQAALRSYHITRDTCKCPDHSLG